LKNAHLLRFPYPSLLNVPQSTPRSSGLRGPCIWAFLNSLYEGFVQQVVRPIPCRSGGMAERALFVIDKRGIIRYIEVHDINRRPPIEVLIGELGKLKNRKR
jgi:hypothetical protein